MNEMEERALNDALMHAQVKDWQACLGTCAALTDSDDPRLATVARLNVMICQYHQREYAQTLSADLIHLLDHLPPSACPSCLCVSILAAHELGVAEMCKFLMLLLASWTLEPMELPGTPTFIILGGEEQACEIVESADSAPMIEIAEELMLDAERGSDKFLALESLVERYRARSIEMDALPQGRH